MVESTKRPGATDSFRDQGRPDVSKTAKDIADQAIAAGQKFKDQAAEAASSSGEKLKQETSHLADLAREAAQQAGEKLKEAVDEKASSGAQYVGSIAAAMRRASREFDSELPIAGKFIRTAADRVDNVSDKIEAGNLKDLVRETQTFARRQPTAFLGMAILAGFALVRFIKSGADEDSPQGGPANQNNRSGHMPSRPSNAGYRDDFAR